MLTTATTALAWAATGWLGHMMYRHARTVIRAGYQSRIQPSADESLQRLHDEHDAYVNFRGDVINPHRPHPENRLRADRLAAGRELDWIEIPPVEAPTNATTSAGIINATSAGNRESVELTKVVTGTV